MIKKIDIDQEIKNLKQFLDDSEVTHPDYIPPELKEIQSYVLATHARLEKGMEDLILSQVQEKLEQMDKDKWYTIPQKANRISVIFIDV